MSKHDHSMFRRPDITAPFRRWHGAPLRWSERNAIYTMERQRRITACVRAHIIDPWGHDSTDVLISYINWLQRLNPQADTCIIAESKYRADILGLRLHRRPTCTASQRKADNIRGHTFQICLVHNLNPKYARAIHRAVFPIFADPYPGTILIFQTPANQRLPKLSSAYERQISLCDYRKKAGMLTGASLSINAKPKKPPASPVLKVLDDPKLLNHGVINITIPTAAAAAPRPKAKPQQRVH